MMDYLEAKRDDLNYKYIYGDLYILMQNAGRAVAEFISSKLGSGKKILFISGTGNNAGDGFVAAEILRNENNVKVLLIKSKEEIKTRDAKKALESYNGEIVALDSLEVEIERADIIVDGIFGVGIQGEPRPPYDEVIYKINDSGKIIVSIDVPSGIGTKISVIPAYTVTFTDEKEGMSPENSGHIHISDIGIPDSLKTIAGPGDLVYYNLPDPDSHKGMNGTLAIVGGWTFYGSAVIAALGAEKVGIDLVRVYCTETNYGIISSYDPSIIVRKANLVSSRLYEEIRGHKAVLIGPGIGISAESANTVKRVINTTENPMVIDADALKVLKDFKHIMKGKKIVITPHKEEFRIISGLEPTEENVMEFSSEYGIITMLKGKVDFITDGKRIMYARGGNARMTMGGTGDLLAGILAAFVSRGIDPFRATAMAAFVNKRSAELAFNRNSYWYGLNDMIEEIPNVMKRNIEFT